jgi:NOL1/NOP2/sun family putative RNA methylase
MSGREFFLDRYRKLGWEYKKANLKQAIRINSANGQPSDVVNRLQHLGLALTKIPFLENGYSVDKAKFSVGATTEYLLGLYSIQEAAAQIPVTLFTELQEKAVLDACAAPGGKTTQLADLMCNTGAITALDIDRQRLIALSNQLERCRVKTAVVYELDARKVSQLSASYDRILLDVPCSGNFATDKEWFRRRTIRDVERNAALQREILASAVEMLRGDGEIVYSTCSLEPEEDELNVNWASRNLSLRIEKIDCYGEKGLTNVFGAHLDSSLVNCRRIWPGETQGFFVCKFRKGESNDQTNS